MNFFSNIRKPLLRVTAAESSQCCHQFPHCELSWCLSYKFFFFCLNFFTSFFLQFGQLHFDNFSVSMPTRSWTSSSFMYNSGCSPNTNILLLTSFVNRRIFVKAFQRVHICHQTFFQIALLCDFFPCCNDVKDSIQNVKNVPKLLEPITRFSHFNPLYKCLP